MTLLNESGPWVVDRNFSSDSASTSGDVEAMELAHEDAPVVCANNAEQQEESMATGVETQTEAFYYLYRKTVRGTQRGYSSKPLNIALLNAF